MVDYLEERSTSCVSINELRVFFPQVFRGSALPPSLLDVPGNFAFSDWINPQVWSAAFSDGLVLVRQFTESFASACRQAFECDYDAALAQCYEARPDLATSGGGAHQTFLHVLLILIGIRAAYELFNLTLIVGSSAHNSLLLRYRVWIKSGVLLPWLLLFDSTRDTLLYDVVLTDTPPTEYIWELLTNGIFVTAIKLFAQVYFLLRVTQTGLVWFNWLSLLLGAFTAVRLIVQAAWSWRTLHKKALLEEHYAERAESGSEFDLDDIADGGGGTSVNMFTARLL
jgi:hypothetical protein